MPNTPFRVGEGMTVLAPGSHATQEQVEFARSLFDKNGRTAIVEERLMDAVTGISGCGPAYMYVVIEALSDAGVKLGLPRQTARLLASQTMLGAAKLVLSSEAHPAALKDEVTTPAGCTIDGLMELEDGKLRHTLLRAAVAAAKRSASLAEE
jgi:pyrroline-5-carboxylate reductase